MAAGGASSLKTVDVIGEKGEWPGGGGDYDNVTDSAWC